MVGVEDLSERRHRYGMASSKTLNAANLEALGAAPLAELLIEISRGNAAAQRRLRLALAGSAGAAEAARAVLKRLASISRAKTWLDWQKIKPFMADLEAQRRAILDLVAPSDPREAFELIWRLVSCAESVFARSDDGGGRLSDTFHVAARDLGPLAQRAGIHAEELAERAFRVLAADEYGVWDGLIPTLAPQLGRSGLTKVKELVQEWAAEPVARPAAHERRVIGWASSGPIHADDLQSRHRKHAVTFVLQQVADALGDVDGYIEQVDKRARRVPAVAASIARRLLDAGRLQEAWVALDAVEAKLRDQAPMEWDEIRLDVLAALGRSDEAQAFRWDRFMATLNAVHLRAYLRKLPDFDDVEAEERAHAHALTFGDVHQALAFFVGWPDLRRASELVLGRSQALNGNFYELLSPAAEALDSKYPLAATVLHRAMIDFTLRMARSSRYKHAARQLASCREAAARVVSFGSVVEHSAYERALRAAHGRKAAFWQEVDG